MKNRGRFIAWMDKLDAPIRVLYSDGQPVEEILCHHKNYAGDVIRHVIKVRISRMKPVKAYYEYSLPGALPVLLPVEDCKEYLNVLIALDDVPVALSWKAQAG